MLPYNSPNIWYDYERIIYFCTQLCYFSSRTTESVDIRNVSSTSVTLYWGEPCKPNGIITGYIVSYNATTSTANLDCPVEENNMTILKPQKTALEY